MNRYLTEYILKDLDKKIIILTGARQCGKTTIAKHLTSDYEYLNLDFPEDNLIINDMSWDKNKRLLILDEFHKYKNWKKYLKGIYDKQELKQKIVVTGSAKLDTYKKVGDSLAGRYFQFRLFPLDIEEIVQYYDDNIDRAFARIIDCGGFPEPFLDGAKEYYNRWRRTHFDIILRQDLIDDKSVADIKNIEVMAEMLKGRVGGGVSYNNIAKDLLKDHNTIKRWCDVLENMYVIFKITPYSNNIARSLIKEPKYYFFDIGLIENLPSQLENLVALTLLKRLCFIEDVQGKNTKLHYCRTKDGVEIDFYVQIDDKVILIEVKTSEHKVSKNFSYFRKYFKPTKCVQLVLNIDRDYYYEDVEVRALKPWLANISKEIF